MSECDKCGQELPMSLMILDAMGREVCVNTPLLWLMPTANIRVPGIVVTLAKPVCYRAVVLYPRRTETDSLDKTFRIWATSEDGSEVELTGELGEPTLSIYKIANSIGEL